MVSPLKRPMTKVMLGERYMSIPPVVMGTPLTPAEKSIIGTAVTTPVAGRSSHCHPWKVPMAPRLCPSLKAMNSQADPFYIIVDKELDKMVLDYFDSMTKASYCQPCSGPELESKIKIYQNMLEKITSLAGA
ncbi:hypothetical protein SAMN04488492_1186 [Megasphaera elsdenii]|nr:hypothetical protein SAMN04488492_1186 [Megasphaera elsdenii]